MEGREQAQKEGVKCYEIGYHLLPIIAEEQLGAEVVAIKNIIESNEATVLSEGQPFLVDLAYQIGKKIGTAKKKFSKAYFGWIKIEATPESIGVIKKSIEAQDNILRFIVISTAREDTMISMKQISERAAGEVKVVSEVVDRPTITQEELDRSIDSLVIQ